MKQLPAVICTVFVLLIRGLFPADAWAKEISSVRDDLDVVFAVDHSNSMNSNDRDKAALEMVKAFADTVHGDRIRIGYVGYNDRIVSSAPPLDMSLEESGEQLKAAIDSAGYAGNTDLGLGLRYAYELLGQEKGHKQVLVLISDGETDLTGSATGRTYNDSAQDLQYVTDQCKSRGIPIYTVAFGSRFDGSKQALEAMSQGTGAQMYTAQTPEALIQVLYGIFGANLAYTIDQVTDGSYAQGMQTIRYTLDEPYLDEIDVLMISSQPIRDTVIRYGDIQTEPAYLKHYAIAKLTDILDSVRELTLSTNTAANQNLKIYLVSYRSLTPVMEAETSPPKHQDIPFSIYFKDKEGRRIEDEAFYRRFEWRAECRREGQEDGEISPNIQIEDGILKGSLNFERSGRYYLECSLDDKLENCYFAPLPIEVANTQPSGQLPGTITYTRFSGEREFDLNQYFTDGDGDRLSFQLSEEKNQAAKVRLEGNLLTVKPKKAGEQNILLKITDEEGQSLDYTYTVHVVPTWIKYPWAYCILVLAAAFLLWKIFHKKPPEIELIVEEKAQYNFTGKLDAYFTNLPDDMEIAPLTFALHQIKDKLVSIGTLFRDYPELVSQLELDAVYLVPDENRNLVLYHSSGSNIMMGSAVVCQQIRYSVNYGDIIYISSADDSYQLELHYIALIQ